jgi:RNA polymerase sigma-70 factor (ECF subfamily)
LHRKALAGAVALRLEADPNDDRRARRVGAAKISTVTHREQCPDFEGALGSARSGDHAAFAILWRWLQPSLVRWLKVVADDDVEDVASEVWMTVARGLRGFAGSEDAFRSWVFTVARRRAIDAGRRRRRRPQTCPIETDFVDPSRPVDEDVDALESALAMLRQLNASQREVVALRIIVGLDVRETAVVVGKSESAVRVACHRGLRTLATRLTADLVEELVG